MRLAEDQCDELFHDQFNAPYVPVPVRDHTEVLPFKSSRFRNWLCRLFYEFEGDVLGSETASNVINVLNAKAEFEDKTKKLNLRVASITSNETFTIYYDLTDKATGIKVPLSGHCIPMFNVITYRLKLSLS